MSRSPWYELLTCLTLCAHARWLCDAQLALKHRKNKNGSKRVIVFVGSPVTDAPIKLKKLAAQLKKNNVGLTVSSAFHTVTPFYRRSQIDLDIISMGENADNAECLETMVKAAGDNSHLVEIPPGVYPTEVLASSAIVGGGGGGAGGAAGFGGVDPDMDPELAMVMQASLAEARAAAGGGDGNADAPAAGGGGGGDDAMTEDEMLQRAMALSMMDSEPAAAPAPAQTDDSSATADTAPASSSSAPEAPAASAADAPTTPTTTRADEGTGSGDAPTAGDSTGVQDPDFMASLLSGLPGVDVNDPSIQAALASMGGGGAGQGGDADAKKDAKDKEGDK